jgi:hypothetical protein
MLLNPALLGDRECKLKSSLAGFNRSWRITGIAFSQKDIINVEDIFECLLKHNAYADLKRMKFELNNAARDALFPVDGVVVGGVEELCIIGRRRSVIESRVCPVLAPLLRFTSLIKEPYIRAHNF